MFLPPLPPSFDAALRDVDANAPRFREAAAGSLAYPPEGREAEARTAIARLMQDGLAPIRLAALTAAETLGDPALLGPCTALVDDPHQAVRETAVHTCAALGAEDDELVAWATGDDAPRQVGAIQALVGRVAADAEPRGAYGELASALRKGLDSSSAHVRLATVRALGALGLSEDADAVAGRLHDDDAEVRFAAALALADLGDPRAVAPLSEALRRGSFEAAEALGSLDLVDHAETRDALAAVSDRFFAPLLLKAAASSSLARAGDPRGVTGLRAVLNAFRPDGRAYAVSQAAALALGELAPDIRRLLDLSPRRRGLDVSTVHDALATLESAP